MDKQQQRGFTLMELVMAFVVLGVLAAVALPKLAYGNNNATQASVNDVAGALSSASAVNYATRKADASHGKAVANCADLAATLKGGLPDGYTITAAAISADSTVSCTLNSQSRKTATFTATGVI